LNDSILDLLPRITIVLGYPLGVHRTIDSGAGAGLIGWVAERVAAPTVSGHVRRTLRQLKRMVEHEQLRERAAARRAVG
jgi:hypothetical protein